MIVLVRLLNSSPGPVGDGELVADAEAPTPPPPPTPATADAHGAFSVLPTDTDAGLRVERRGRRSPAAPRPVSGTLVAGWSQVVCVGADVGRGDGRALADRREQGGEAGPVSPAADMLPRPVMKCRPTPPKRCLEGALELAGPVGVGDAAVRALGRRVGGVGAERGDGPRPAASCVAGHVGAEPAGLLGLGAAVGVAALAVERRGPGPRRPR